MIHGSQQPFFLTWLAFKNTVYVLTVSQGASRGKQSRCHTHLTLVHLRCYIRTSILIGAAQGETSVWAGGGRTGAELECAYLQNGPPLLIVNSCVSGPLCGNGQLVAPPEHGGGGIGHHVAADVHWVSLP